MISFSVHCKEATLLVASLGNYIYFTHFYFQCTQLHKHKQACSYGIINKVDIQDYVKYFVVQFVIDFGLFHATLQYVYHISNDLIDSQGFSKKKNSRFIYLHDFLTISEIISEIYIRILIHKINIYM